METKWKFEGFFIKYDAGHPVYGPVCVCSKQSYTERKLFGGIRTDTYDTILKRFDTVGEAEEYLTNQAAIKDECDKRATLYHVK